MIAIVGAGPSGSYLASMLAKDGKEVSLIEEHPEVGNPVQCTGILSSSSDALNVKIPEKLIVNKIKRVQLISPNQNSLTFNLKEPDLILDRKEFDKYLAEEAVKNGAKLLLQHRFVDYKENKLQLRHKGEITVKNFDALIGSDGPSSQVAKASNLYGNRRFWIARQCRAKIKCEKDLFKVHFNKDISPDFFGWVVPENDEVARIGIGAEKNSEHYFKKYLEMLNVKEIIDYQAGLIPIYDPKPKRINKNVYLIGDAALQVKALSGGGIIKGMLAAEELYNSLTNNLDYEMLWRKRMGMDLLLSLKMRNFLNKLSNKDYDSLVESFNENALTEFNREFPKKSLIKVILKNPKLDFFLMSKIHKLL
ncbi:MAG: NAD(P)/FAD-dependent oxidoreductase [Nanoarchaeota archaeon]